jgi:hypothetical protein
MERRLCAVVFLALGAISGCSGDDTSAVAPPVVTGGGSSGAGGAGSGVGGAAGGSVLDASGKLDATSDGSAPLLEAGDSSAADADVGDPMLLSQTGLYSNIATGELAPGVFAFQPQFALWSDGAAKKRWVKLPAGMKIDTSDMNYWQYPEGTKLWKEFTRDGVRVETRMIMKRGGGDWFFMAYKWMGTTEAVAVPNGERNASGTQHDIPSQADCGTCHNSMKDRVLGFTAIQLSHDLPGLNIDQVVANGWLTDPPVGTGDASAEAGKNRFIVPGNATEKAALGYLHANCGMCHNERGKVGLLLHGDMWLHFDKLSSVADTATYQTLVDQAAPQGNAARTPKWITPGNPAMSAIHELMSLRDSNQLADAGNPRQMPPLASELVDMTGLAAVDAWINALGKDH